MSILQVEENKVVKTLTGAGVVTGDEKSETGRLHVGYGSDMGYGLVVYSIPTASDTGASDTDATKPPPLVLDGNYTFASAGERSGREVLTLTLTLTLIGGGRSGREVLTRMGNRKLKDTEENEPNDGTSIDGIFSLKGSHATDPGHPKAGEWAYEGLLTVSYAGLLEGGLRSYQCSWSVAGDEYSGIGVRTSSGGEEYLTVGWGEVSYGVAQYARIGERLEGWSALQDLSKFGLENLSEGSTGEAGKLFKNQAQTEATESPTAETAEDGTSASGTPAAHVVETLPVVEPPPAGVGGAAGLLTPGNEPTVDGEPIAKPEPAAGDEPVAPNNDEL